MSESSLTLYWNIVSPPSRAVKVLLDIGKIDCKLVSIDLFRKEQNKPWFKKINMMEQVPVLVTG